MGNTTKLPGFIGGSYRSEAVFADVQRCVNWYPEIVESGVGENSMTLMPCPGTTRFLGTGSIVTAGTDTGGSPRGMIELNGQLFIVIGTSFVEVGPDGSFTRRNFSNGNDGVAKGTYEPLADDGKPVSMAANNVGQIFICAGGQGYCYGVPQQVNTPAPGTTPPTPTGFQSIPNDGVNFFGCSQVIFLDDYFCVLVPNSSTIQVSALNDGTTWGSGPAGVNVALVEGQADHLSAISVDREFLYLWGNARAEVWYDAGSSFPFQIQPGAFIEQGIAAPFSVQKVDNAQMWLGQDARGNAVVWRSNGFTPLRVSTHATEWAWQQYSTVADARAFTYQQNGHNFYVLTFPTADATWVYDVATKLWHERTFTDANGLPHACAAAFHAFAFGQHLVQCSRVGTGVILGQVFVLSTSVYQDLVASVYPLTSAYPIVRDRITPHVYEEDKRYFCNYIELRCQTGIGLSGGMVPGKLPQMILRVSRDGGENWGEEQWKTAGAIGNYMQRLKWNLPGAWRDGVLWFRATDPVQWALIDCYINGELGSN